MRIPKILYHGTTVLRWDFIKSNGLLRCNMDKSFKAEEYVCLNTGYVYLTTDLDEGIMYGLNKSLLDMQYLHIPENIIRANPNYRDPVVLGINGFKLGDNLEIDPQVNTLVQQLHDMKNQNTQWYRYKGDIKVKHLRACKYVSFDTFSSNLIDKFTKDNERKLQASQSIMKQLFPFR